MKTKWEKYISSYITKAEKESGIRFLTSEGCQWWAEKSIPKFIQTLRTSSYHRCEAVISDFEAASYKINVVLLKFVKLLTTTEEGLQLSHRFRTSIQMWDAYFGYLDKALSDENSLMWLVTRHPDTIKIQDVRERAETFYNEFVAYILKYEYVIDGSFLSSEEKLIISEYRKLSTTDKRKAVLTIRDEDD